jgi:hypothetical protein
MALMLSEMLKLNAEAAARGQYEVGYHLLMAALHAADHEKDLAVLERIATLAREQGEAVERVQPPHQLSSYHAQLRGQTPVFDSLGTHIDAVRLRLQSEVQRVKRHR